MDMRGGSLSDSLHGHGGGLKVRLPSGALPYYLPFAVISFLRNRHWIAPINSLHGGRSCLCQTSAAGNKMHTDKGRS